MKRLLIILPFLLLLWPATQLKAQTTPNRTSLPFNLACEIIEESEPFFQQEMGMDTPSLITYYQNDLLIISLEGKNAFRVTLRECSILVSLNDPS